MEKPNNDNITISDFKAIKDKLFYLTDDIVVSKSLTDVPGIDHQRFRLGFFAIMTCIEGEMHLEINGIPYDLMPYDFLIIFPTMQVSNVVASECHRIRFSGFSTRFLLRIRQRRDSQIKVLQDFANRPVLHKSDPNRRDKFRYYADLLNHKLSTPEASPFREDIIEYIFSALLCEMIDEIINTKLSEQREAPVLPAGSPRILRGNVIFKEFIEHVNRDNGMHRSLAHFADVMCYSPKYLSLVIKQVSGRSPMDWINEVTMEQIKYQLVHTERSMKEIADLFDFPNQSFFGKYVKAHLGMSPARYREERTRG